MPGELEKGFNVGNEPNRNELRTGKTNRSELRTGNEPKIQPEKHREPQFAIQFELQTPVTHYGKRWEP